MAYESFSYRPVGFTYARRGSMILPLGSNKVIPGYGEGS
jgi:hypothetical protein